ncbi:glycosyltransferase family 4 protein [Pontibacter sp. H259]|uniref:glycosyltransferase family 4 protein n=1 Tax=Pontibacter sp. H259 TaxID=3133421 RepID=UPI0030C44704
MNMTVGVCGPIDLKSLDWDLKHDNLPDTNAFPLTSHLINALLKRGYKVIGYTNSPVLQKSQILESGNLKICIATTRPKPGRRFFNFEIEELRKLIVANPADIITALWTYEYAWAALKTHVPTVVNIHDNAFQILRNQPDLFRFVRWLMNAMAVNKAKNLVANSNYTYSLLSRFEKRKTITINNFYTPDIETISQQVTTKGNYIVSVVMGFTERKNIQGSLQAFAKVRARFPDVEYHLVGVEMEENGQAHQYALQNNIADGVRFIGALPFEEVVLQTAGAKVLLHPSYEESFGMAVLEAMVAGTPVVAGENSGFIPELLENGKSGLLCDITSPDAMAACVIKLLENDNLREDLAQNARKYARANFSEEVVVAKHLSLFNQILGLNQEPELHREPFEPNTESEKRLSA